MVKPRARDADVAAAAGNTANSSAVPTLYSERWSLHPGEAQRVKRGLTAKEQQALAKDPVVLPQETFESPALQRKAFYADQSTLIFCGEVQEVLGWLRDAGILVDCIVTSPPFYGQRDYGVVGQIGLELRPQEYIAKLVDVFCDAREVLQTTGSLWVNMGDTCWNGRGQAKGLDAKQLARRFGLRPQDRRGDGKLCKNKQLLLIPHRFAIAMQDEDWIVRNDNVWVKPKSVPGRHRCHGNSCRQPDIRCADSRRKPASGIASLSHVRALRRE